MSRNGRQLLTHLGHNVGRILTRSDTNQAVQPLEMARGLKFCIKEVEVLYYPSSENKGKAHLRVCFRICKTLVFLRRGSFIDTFYLYFEVCLGTKVLQIKIQDAIFVCLNFYATVRRKKKKKKKKNARGKTAPRNALDRCEALFLLTVAHTGKCCKMF